MTEAVEMLGHCRTMEEAVLPTIDGPGSGAMRWQIQGFRFWRDCGVSGYNGAVVSDLWMVTPGRTDLPDGRQIRSPRCPGSRPDSRFLEWSFSFG